MKNLSIKFALYMRNKSYIEFLLHNCVREIDPEWFKFAISDSNAECLQVLLDEYPQSIVEMDLNSLVTPDIFESDEKRDVILSAIESYKL